MRSWLVCRPRFFVLFLLTPSLAGAQIEVQPGTQGRPEILGRVVDAASRQPIQNADVILRDSLDVLVASTLGDETGFFRLIPERSGRFFLTVRQIGYAPLTGRIEYDGTGQIIIVAPLSVTPVELEGVEAVGRIRPRHAEMSLQGFEARKARAVGSFFDWRDIEKLRPTRITDVLQRVPGVQVVRQGGQVRDIQITHAQGQSGGGFYNPSRPCLASIWLDGILVREGGYQLENEPGAEHKIFFLNDAVPAEQIGGIEVYAHISRIPPQFRDSSSMCGVIVLWSRRENPPE